MKMLMGLGRVAVLSALAVVVVSATPARPNNDDEKFGKGVSLKDSTSIKALYETPEKFVGKTIRIDGVVTAVCEEMGCWMALGEKAGAENTVRLKVDHDAGIVFPLAAKGKEASAEGVFEKIAAGDKEAKEAAAEHAGHAKAGEDFGKKYQLKATGAVVK
ncbi:MAG TPA: DUF4920 domain-containing protein [Vicinamibacterales bacterium]|nr:DUF4920 domain-containing protein [Vicinamibacterales bacterium]